MDTEAQRVVPVLGTVLVPAMEIALPGRRQAGDVVSADAPRCPRLRGVVEARAVEPGLPAAPVRGRVERVQVDMAVSG